MLATDRTGRITGQPEPAGHQVIGRELAISASRFTSQDHRPESVYQAVCRSGVTIAVALLLGVQSSAAFRFSFLVSLPAIVGAATYEASGAEGLGSLGPEAWVGGLTALVTGYVALVILRHIILVGRMWTFAIYLLPLGLFLITR